MPKTPEQIEAWKALMEQRKAEKAARMDSNVAVMEREPEETPVTSDFDPLEGVPEEARAALRNVTLKEGVGLSFSMDLEKFEQRAKALWPDLHTVLVQKDELNHRSKIAEYEGNGYVMVEDGSKSRHTVPSSDMVRMGCSLKEYEALEELRVREQNERHGHYTSKDAPIGTPFKDQKGTASLGSILAGMPE